MKQVFLSLTIFFLAVCNIKGQIKWNLIDDTITLSPNIVTAIGDVTIQPGKAETSLQVSGALAIILNAKTVILKNGNDIFNFKEKDLLDLQLIDYGRFKHEELFKDKFTDSLYKYYRKSLYSILELNKYNLIFQKGLNIRWKTQGLL